MLHIVFDLKSTSLDFYSIDVKVRIGQRIKELRDTKDMAQKDLANAVDLDKSYIASIENEQRNVYIVNIEKISKALAVTLKYFLIMQNLTDNHLGLEPILSRIGMYFLIRQDSFLKKYRAICL